MGVRVTVPGMVASAQDLTVTLPTKSAQKRATAQRLLTLCRFLKATASCLRFSLNINEGRRELLNLQLLHLELALNTERIGRLRLRGHTQTLELLSGVRELNFTPLCERYGLTLSGDELLEPSTHVSQLSLPLCEVNPELADLVRLLLARQGQ